MRSYIRCLASLLFCLSLLSGTADAGDMRVSQAYTRVTPPGTTSAALYLTLHNEAEERRVLIAGTSSRGKRLMIHQNQWQDDMMRMRHLAELEIAGHSQVEFKPGGLHLMLTGLSGRLQAGEVLLLQLQFQNGQVLVVNVPVLAVGVELEPLSSGKINVHHE